MPVDRSRLPDVGPDPPFYFPSMVRHGLDNGLHVRTVEHHSVPVVTLDPELALVLFVAPVLLDAAFDASVRDLRHNWRPVAGLALLTVGITVAAVAVTVRTMMPDVPWTAAVVLGAVVAPPDAAAATAVLRQLRPPHRLLVILEGESLFNDASALLIYRLAVGAAAAGAISSEEVVPTLLFATVGSIVLGWASRRSPSG